MAASGGVPDVNIQYSDYFAGLEGPAKSRYLLSKVQYPNNVNHMVLQTSWATKTQMKAYKSMDAYTDYS